MMKKEKSKSCLVYAGLASLSMSCLCCLSPFLFGIINSIATPSSNMTIKFVSDFLLSNPRLSFLFGIGAFSLFVIGIVLIIMNGASGSTGRSSGSFSTQSSQGDNRPDYGHFARQQEYEREMV